MKNKIIYIIPVLAMLLTFPFYLNSKPELTSKHGLIYINGVAGYLDPEKIYGSTIFSTRKFIKKSKSPIIKSGIIYFYFTGSDKNPQWYMSTFDLNRDKGDYWQVRGSNKKYFYKVVNNKMYMSKNKRKWDRILINVIDENPMKKNPKEKEIIIFNLSCKYFSGEYCITTR
jgi:hypothetical protein